MVNFMMRVHLSSIEHNNLKDLWPILLKWLGLEYFGSLNHFLVSNKPNIIATELHTNTSGLHYSMNERYAPLYQNLSKGAKSMRVISWITKLRCWCVGKGINWWEEYFAWDWKAKADKRQVPRYSAITFACHRPGTLVQGFTQVSRRMAQCGFANVCLKCMHKLHILHLKILGQNLIGFWQFTIEKAMAHLKLFLVE